jgi:HAD superfamily hydrolase (TIGR01509 family)
MTHTWFVFDLGNVVIKLAYERVLATICAAAETSRDEIVRLLDGAGGYRDLERGLISFEEFHRFLESRIRYRGDLTTFREVWSDFFEGPLPGIEEVLDRVRARYRVAFLSNSNEVHAEVIPRKFAPLFHKDDRFIFSHRYRCAKPDPEIYRRTLEVLGTTAPQVLFTDDLLENVVAARQMGMTAFQFENAGKLLRTLEREGLLSEERMAKREERKG